MYSRRYVKTVVDVGVKKVIDGVTADDAVAPRFCQPSKNASA
jgi:hypothetical protein